MHWLLWVLLLGPVFSILWAIAFWVLWRMSTDPVIVRKPKTRKSAKALDKAING